MMISKDATRFVEMELCDCFINKDCVYITLPIQKNITENLNVTSSGR